MSSDRPYAPLAAEYQHLIDKTPAFLRDPLALLNTARVDVGDAFRLDIFGHPNVFLLDKSASRFILQDNSSALSAEDGNLDIAQRLFGQSILYREDLIHRTTRAALHPIFTRAAIREKHTHLRDIFDSRSSTWVERNHIDIFAEARRYTISVALLFTLGYIPSEFKYLLRAIDRLAIGLYSARPSRLPHSNFRRGLRSRRRLVRRFSPLLEYNVSSRNPTCAIGALRDLPQRFDNPDFALDQALTLLFAGYDTTSAVIAWLVDYLLRDQQMLNELVAESRKSDIDSFDGCMSLKLLGNAIRETERLRPPVYFIPRMTREPICYNDHWIPRGWIVNASPLIAQRDMSELSHPGNFQPQRQSANDFFPFGKGPKYCIGALLADVEIRTFVSRLLRSFDLVQTDARPLANKFVSSYSPVRGPVIRVTPLKGQL